MTEENIENRVDQILVQLKQQCRNITDKINDDRIPKEIKILGILVDMVTLNMLMRDVASVLDQYLESIKGKHF
jgi:hypothetical protein